MTVTKETCRRKFRTSRTPSQADPHRPRAASGAREADFDKLSSVFLSGNRTRDDQPSHIRIQRQVPLDLARMWEHMCPAQVYEVGAPDGDDTVHVEVNPSNCVQCGRSPPGATDAAEGGFQYTQT
jgi:electron-transferring-flavoprotein dehydrogenase